jgi:hypothetical protein
MDGLTVLVEAKKEYLGQLCGVLCPVMIETFENLYIESQKMSKGREVLKQFQKNLKEVPNWNNHMIHQHTEKLSSSCGWFNDLMAAVFVSYVKILSSVRLNAAVDKKISVKLPTNDVFVHGCYTNAAKDLYKDPFLFHEELSEYERDDRLTRRFVACIEATVKEMLPVQEILKTYITQTGTVDMSTEPEGDTEDPEIAGEGGDGAEEVPAPAEEGTTPEEGAPAPPPVPVLDAVPPIAPITPEDVKNIDVKGSTGEDELFPDARE